MADARLVHVEKILSGGGDRFVVKMLNSAGVVVWSSAELEKSDAVNQLLEMGLPSWKIPAKFADAQSRDGPKEEPVP